MTTDTIPQAQAEERIIEIPLDQLRESPFQQRMLYRGLEGLAASIKAEGRVHSPLLVRPIRPNPLRMDLIEGYELVFGHRRLRALRLAEMSAGHCMVREMSDAQARSAQIAENLQRDDLNAVEEAFSLQDLFAHDGLSADEIAAAVGLSRTHVYAQLKLAKACEAVRRACLADDITGEVARLVARVQTHKLQEKALAAIKADNIDIGDGGKASSRRVKALLAEKFTLDLTKAIFDTADATLDVLAGSCTQCPKRTGNAPEYADLVEYKPMRWDHASHRERGSASLCTDPECFEAKKKAHLAAEAATLRKAGQQVVDGNKARAVVSAQGDIKGGFIAADKVKALVKKLPKDGVVNGVAVPQQVLIQDPRGGKVVKAYRTADLVGAGLMSAQVAAKAKAPDHDSRRHEGEERERKQAAQAQAETQRHLNLLRHVRGVVATRPRDAFDLRLCVAAALAGVAYEDRPTLALVWEVTDAEALKRRIDTMTPAELTTLLMDCAIVDDVKVSPWGAGQKKPLPLLALANHYGIDAKAAMRSPAQDEDAPSTPSTAGAGAHEAAAARAKARPAKKAKATPTARAVAFRCPETHATWSGRGLKPAWLRAALAKGRTLDELRAPLASKPMKAKAGAAGDEVKVEAGSAGNHDTQTADLFAEAGA